MKRVRLALGLCFLLCLHASGADAPFAAFQDFPKAHTRARLVASQDGIHVERPTYIALDVRLDKNWHTYWENPGDSGAAPILKYEAPQGVTVSPLPLPPPTRFEKDPFVTFGYENRAWFPAQVFIDRTWKVGQEVALTLHAEWLVCKEECIPARGTFHIKLPVKGTGSLHPTPFVKEFEGVQRVRNLPDTFHLEKVGNDYEISGDLEGPWEIKDFFPLTDSHLSLFRPQFEKAGEAVRIRIAPDPNFTGGIEKTAGLITVVDARSGKLWGFYLQAKSETEGIWRWLFFALLGGLLLNLMPCVFPVLSIKVFSLLQLSLWERKLARYQALYYAAGVIASMWVLAGGLALLRAGGQQLGWGFQLQSPYFVAFLSALFTLMGLSFLGWLNLQVPLPAFVDKRSKDSGARGDFFTGVLSTVVATPCTAPFLGAAMGIAFSRAPWEMFLIFTAVGIGLALPYVLFSFSPALQKFLPKPGRWMEHVKKWMALPLFATALWLLWLLSQITTPVTSSIVLASLVVVALYFSFKNIPKKKYKAWVVAAALSPLAIGAWHVWAQAPQGEPSTTLNWEVFSPEAVAEARAKGQAVFIDFTASWCLTCQVNKQVTFSNPAVEAYLQAHNVRTFRADWTKPDPVITKTLKEYDRVGVPFYLFWAPRQKEATILPEVLTPTIFLDNLNRTLVPKETQ